MKIQYSKKIFLSLLLCATSLLFSGCVSEYQPVVTPEGDASSVKLAEAADSVNKSLETLEGIKKAEMPAYKKKLPMPYGAGLNGLVSIDWTGPIAPLVKKLAVISGYHFRQLGNAPSIPIIISLHKQDVTLASVLRDTDFQAGSKADLRIMPRSRTIELRYHR